MATNVISSLNYDGNIYPFTLPYGVCSTAAATAAKVVNVGNFSLEAGAVVIVKFSNANTAASPTLNVSSTGAKSIVRYGTMAAGTDSDATGWLAGAVQLFVYDGTSWVRNYWANNTPNGHLPIRLQEYQAGTGAVTDANLATKTGFYYMDTTAKNRPSFSQSSNKDYRILTTAYSDTWLQQIATDFRCNDIFYRRNENGTWKPWVQIQTTESADARYLRLAGGTLTGDVALKDSTVNITRAGISQSWYQGRNSAIIKTTSYSGYDAILSMKTTAGDWALGVYSDNKLYFTYVLDSNYNANNNATTAQIRFDPDGTVVAPKFSGALSGNATSATKATQDGNGNVISSTYAKLATWNNLIHNSNEFTFASAGYNSYIWFNYRTASGDTDGAITGYKFGNGKGALAGVTVEAAKFKGALEGNATSASALTDITTSDKASSTATKRRVWFCYDNNTTGRPAYDDRFTIQTSTGTLFAPIFSGSLSGNATSATKATQDGNGNVISSTYLKLSGGTMTGQILTSFKSAVATGSYAAAANTVPDLLTELRYSSGCMGSVSISTAYTSGAITIAAGWYNFLYIPHRSGGVNGVASGDNCNYGTLLLMGMTVNNACYRIRYANSTVAEVARISDSNSYSSIADGRYVNIDGDTMTGLISYKTTNYTSTPVAVYDDGTNYGHSLVIGAGGTTYIGAGEAASTLYSTKLKVTSTEDLILGADSNIRFHTNADSATTTNGVTLNTSNHFYPQTNNTGSVGTSGNKWGSMYATTFYGALSGNASTATVARLTEVILNNSSNWKLGLQWRNTTLESGTYLAGIGRHNTGGSNANYPGTISIIPYATNTEPWGGSAGLFINKDYIQFEGQPLLHSGNYTTYTVKKDGTGASGTWGINITGNANTLDNIDSTGFLRYYNGNNAGITNADVVNATSYAWTVSTTGGGITTATKPGSMDNAWGVLHMHLHTGNYAMQLGFGGTTGNLYMRNAYNSATFGGWRTILDSGNYTGHLDGRYVNVSGDTMTGLLTVTTGSSHGGIKMGGTYVTSIDNQVIFQNNTGIRFGTDSWDWNCWAGLKYVHGSNNKNGIIYLGVADGTVFNANASQSEGTLALPGIRYFSINGKTVIDAGDSWLRINEGNAHSSGIYFGTSLTRTDGQFQVGSGGSKFYANSSGNGYFSNNLSVGGKLIMTGNIAYTNGGNQYDIIRFVTGDSAGAGVVIGGGGTAIFGSGESAYNFQGSSGANIGGSTETTYITSDNGIEFYTNCQTIGSRVGVILNASRQFYPNVNATGSLGTSSYKWSAVWTSGTVTANKLKISNTSGISHIEFSRESHNYIHAPSDAGTVALCANATLSLANCGLVVAKAAVYPGANNTYTLGTSSYKWSHVYATSFTGTLYGSATSVRDYNDSTPTKFGYSTSGMTSASWFAVWDATTSGEYRLRAMDAANMRSNLSVYSKSEANSRYVNVSGDTMTGSLYVTHAASGGEKQIGMAFGKAANSSTFYIWGNTTTGTRGIYDSVLGYAIQGNDGAKQFLHHGTLVTKSAQSYGTAAQRDAVASPATGQVFFVLV